MSLAKKVILFIVVFVVLFVFGFFTYFFVTGMLEEKQVQTYSSSGFTIQLPGDFVEKELLNTTCHYVRNDAMVGAIKEDFETLTTMGIATKDSSLNDYMDVVLKTNKTEVKNVKSSKDGKYLYFSYEETVSGKLNYYTAMVFKGSDAFWLVNFACDSKNKEKYKDVFHDWAGTIVVE